MALTTINNSHYLCFSNYKKEIHNRPIPFNNPPKRYIVHKIEFSVSQIAIWRDSFTPPTLNQKQQNPHEQ
jgi:hypothetical protein